MRGLASPTHLRYNLRAALLGDGRRRRHGLGHGAQAHAPPVAVWRHDNSRCNGARRRVGEEVHVRQGHRTAAGQSSTPCCCKPLSLPLGRSGCVEAPPPTLRQLEEQAHVVGPTHGPLALALGALVPPQLKRLRALASTYAGRRVTVCSIHVCTFRMEQAAMVASQQIRCFWFAAPTTQPDPNNPPNSLAIGQALHTLVLAWAKGRGRSRTVFASPRNSAPHTSCHLTTPEPLPPQRPMHHDDTSPPPVPPAPLTRPPPPMRPPTLYAASGMDTAMASASATSSRDTCPTRVSPWSASSRKGPPSELSIMPGGRFGSWHHFQAGKGYAGVQAGGQLPCVAAGGGCRGCKDRARTWMGGSVVPLSASLEGARVHKALGCRCRCAPLPPSPVARTTV